MNNKKNCFPLDTNGFYDVLEIVDAKNNENPLLSLFIQEI